jgi:hypothetical protein
VNMCSVEPSPTAGQLISVRGRRAARPQHGAGGI